VLLFKLLTRLLSVDLVKGTLAINEVVKSEGEEFLCFHVSLSIWIDLLEAERYASYPLTCEQNRTC
jgi:hypothetical protein